MFMFIINTFSTCFGHHYAHLQETKTCVTARGMLRWFCWMWLQVLLNQTAAVVLCSNRLRVLNWKISRACWAFASFRFLWPCIVSKLWSERENQQYATVASCWFSLSLHNLLTMHGHRNLNKESSSLYQTTLLVNNPLLLTSLAACFGISIALSPQANCYKYINVTLYRIANQRDIQDRPL